MKKFMGHSCNAIEYFSDKKHRYRQAKQVGIARHAGHGVYHPVHHSLLCEPPGSPQNR